MALDDFQISFGGLTVGDGTDYDLASEEGLESWDVRSGDVAFPNQWGSLIGTDEVTARRIRFTVEMFAEDPTLVLAFEDAFLPATGDDLDPLVAKFPGRDEIALDVRCRSRSRRRTVNETLGIIAVDVELVAPDPRAYSSDLHTSTLPVYTAGGEGFNLTLSSATNLAADLTAGSGTDLAGNFTGSTASGDVVCANAGNVDTYPSFTITPSSLGSVTSCEISNLTTGETIALTPTIAAGQTLTVDMAMVATPKQGEPITLNGEGRYGAWAQPRTALRLAPGDNTLRFEVLSGTTTDVACAISWRDAYL
jgi:hypothetical protein